MDGITSYINGVGVVTSQHSSQRDPVFIQFKFRFQVSELLISTVVTPQTQQRALLLQGRKWLGRQGVSIQAGEGHTFLRSISAYVALKDRIDLSLGPICYIPVNTSMKWINLADVYIQV